MRTLKLAAAVTLIAAAAACGGKSSPLSPTSTTASASPAPSVAGATILGSVRTGSSVLAESTGSAAAAGLTVQIAGTNMSTTVGSSGQFTFSGVPAGPVTLKFSGAGVDASVSLTPVSSTQTVTVTVRVNGSDATLETEAQDDNNSGESEVNGIISGLTGTASSFQFMVGSRQVQGDSQTQFFGDGSSPDTFSNLKNGVRVEVKGTLKSTYVYANRIHINDGSSDNNGNNGGDNGDQEAEASGAISGLSGSCPSITFSIKSQVVQTNGSTAFSGATCSSIANGADVEVSGTKQSNGTILAQKVKVDDNGKNGGDNGDQEADASGAISGLSGSCPSLSFALGSQGVQTNSATTFAGITCSSLKNGDKVEVSGTKQSSGSILASKVKKDN